MAITNPSHWWEPYHTRGPKYDKILEMIAELNTPTVPAPPATHETSHRSGGGDALTDVAFLAGNQTINGIKTFGSIPVLPASNPTAANEATRKAYVDAHLMIGSANKEWVSCPPNHNAIVYNATYGAYRMHCGGNGIDENRSTSGNIYFSYEIVFPFSRGGLSLYIDAIELTINAADDDNFVTGATASGAKLSGSTTIYNSIDNYKGPGTVLYDSGHSTPFPTTDMSGYTRGRFYATGTCNTASALKIAGVRVQCYYA